MIGKKKSCIFSCSESKYIFLVILGLKQGKESINATEELLLITSFMMEQLITELNWPDTVWVFSWALMQILKEMLKPLEGMMV